MEQPRSKVSRSRARPPRRCRINPQGRKASSEVSHGYALRCAMHTPNRTALLEDRPGEPVHRHVYVCVCSPRGISPHLPPQPLARYTRVVYLPARDAVSRPATRVFGGSVNKYIHMRV